MKRYALSLIGPSNTTTTSTTPPSISLPSHAHNTTTKHRYLPFDRLLDPLPQVTLTVSNSLILILFSKLPLSSSHQSRLLILAYSPLGIVSLLNWISWIWFCFSLLASFLCVLVHLSHCLCLFIFSPSCNWFLQVHWL